MDLQNHPPNLDFSVEIYKPLRKLNLEVIWCYVINQNHRRYLSVPVGSTGQHDQRDKEWIQGLRGMGFTPGLLCSKTAVTGDTFHWDAFAASREPGPLLPSAAPLLRTLASPSASHLQRILFVLTHSNFLGVKCP